MFLLGLTAVVLGALGLARAADAGPRLRRAAAVLGVAGLAATGTAIGLVGTAHQGAAGEVIPALHDAANDRLIAFTPVCGQAGGVPVCVHPAYRAYLDDVTAGFRPVLSEVAGLPGAPARITQIGDPTLSPPVGKFGGSPPVFYYSMPVLGSAFGQTTRDFTQNLQNLFVAAFIAGPQGFVGQGGTPAQQVVQTGAAQGDWLAVGFARPRAWTAEPGDDRRGRAVRRAARRGPARLAHYPSGRAAGRSHHPGPAAVTAAGLRKPEPRAEAPRPRRLLDLAGLRLVRLHLASRRVPGALAALALCGLVLRAALYWHWSLGSGPGAQELAVVLEAGAASVIAVTAQSPFGDPERATGRWLPYLRLGTAVGLTAAAFGALCAGAAAEQLPGGTLDILRNTAGMTGIGLLLAAVIGGALAWVGPMAYMIVCLFAVSDGWTTPWLWPARPPHDLGGALCAGLVFAAGLRPRPGRPPSAEARRPPADDLSPAAAGLAVAEAVQEAAEDPALAGQRRGGRRCRRPLTRDGLVVVGPGDGVDDLLLVEVLRPLDLGHVTDQHPVPHDLRFKAGGAVGVPLGLAAAGQRHAHAVLVHTRLGQVRIDAAVAQCVGHPPGPVLVHAQNVAKERACPGRAAYRLDRSG